MTLTKKQPRIYKSFPSIILVIIGVMTLLFFQRCSEIRELSNSRTDNITANNYSKLNGRYSNSPSTADTISWVGQIGMTYQPKSFWNLTHRFTNEKAYANAIGQTVGLNFKSKQRLSLSLYQGDSLIAKKLIRGKILNGYFCPRQHLSITPFFPVVFGYSGFTYRIGLDNGNLSVDYAWKYWGFAILAGGFGKGQTHSTFEKK